MDPVLQKLLDLWELDDSALSDHSLQASNSLSVSKHLSLYSEKPVLREPLHHVESLSTRTSHGPDIVWSQSSTVESSAGELLCEKCRYANEEHANWCIECGTALMGTRIETQTGVDLADLNGEMTTEFLPPFFDRAANQNPASDIEINSLNLSDRRDTNATQNLNDQDTCSDHQVLEYSVCGDLEDNKQTMSIPKSPMWSCTSPVMSKTHPNNRTKKFRYTTTNKSATTSQLVTRKEYQRHWNSSSTYMWRKPSSIPNSTSCLVNHAHDQKNNGSKLYTGSESRDSISTSPKLHVTNNRVVPILDLDAIDEDSTSVCTSIRTSSSINENLSCGRHLLSLPDELMLMVLSNLDQRDLLKCMLVCRRLFHVASDATLWKCIRLQKCSGICDEHLLWMRKKTPAHVVLHNCKGTLSANVIQQFFRGCASTLKVLSMSLCDFGLRGGDTVFLSAALYCPKLCNITFNWCNLSESAVIKGFHKFSRLEEVCIDQQSNGGFGVEALNVLIKKHGKTLRKLDIGSLDSSIAMACCSQQRLTNLGAFAGTFMKVSETTFKLIAFVFPKLKELAFRYYTESTLDSKITKQLLSLQLESLSMKLSNSSGLSSLSCTHINQMITLRSLTVDCVSDDALQTLCSGKLWLKFLDLSHSNITDKSFSFIGDSSFASTLTHVRMSKCHGIDVSYSTRVMERSLKQRGMYMYESSLQELLLEFVQKCRRLRVIDLSWLYCVQDLNFRDFRHCKILTTY